MKNKVFKIIGIVSLAAAVIAIILAAIGASWWNSITSSKDIIVYREFYSPNGDYVLVDCTDLWGLRDQYGFVHIYQVGDKKQKEYSEHDDNVLWKIVSYDDYAYGGPFLISWIDDTHVRIDNDCFDVEAGEYIDDYTPTYPFYSTVEFYSPDGKYVVVDCTKEEENGVKNIILLYETENHETHINEPEKYFSDTNYLVTIKDADEDFGKMYGGCQHLIKWENDDEVRMGDAVYSITESKIIKEY